MLFASEKGEFICIPHIYVALRLLIAIGLPSCLFPSKYNAIFPLPSSPYICEDGSMQAALPKRIIPE
jgi:hypothetical protein